VVYPECFQYTLRAGPSIHPAAEPEKLTGEFVFTSLVANLAVLITPAGPVWVNHPSELVALQTPDGKLDPVEFLSEPPVMLGEKYIVHANVSEPTIVQLRNAGDTYPDWVTAENLQLPDNISPKILALAQRISAQAKTPYDKADAITQYLRNNITYSSTVENSPPGQDSLIGSCLIPKKDSVIIMPARKSFYYAAWESLPEWWWGSPRENLHRQTFTLVRERDEHAWPEVYFPGVGWVEFEPTSNQAPLVRPPGDNLPSAGLTGTETPAFPTGQHIPGQPTPIPAGEASTNTRSGMFVNWLPGTDFDLRHHRYDPADLFLWLVR